MAPPRSAESEAKRLAAGADGAEGDDDDDEEEEEDDEEEEEENVGAEEEEEEEGDDDVVDSDSYDEEEEGGVEESDEDEEEVSYDLTLAVVLLVVLHHIALPCAVLCCAEQHCKLRYSAYIVMQGKDEQQQVHFVSCSSCAPAMAQLRIRQSDINLPLACLFADWLAGWLDGWERWNAVQHIACVSLTSSAQSVSHTIGQSARASQSQVSLHDDVDREKYFAKHAPIVFLASFVYYLSIISFVLPFSQEGEEEESPVQVPQVAAVRSKKVPPPAAVVAPVLKAVTGKRKQRDTSDDAKWENI